MPFVWFAKYHVKMCKPYAVKTTGICLQCNFTQLFASKVFANNAVWFLVLTLKLLKKGKLWCHKTVFELDLAELPVNLAVWLDAIYLLSFSTIMDWCWILEKKRNLHPLGIPVETKWMCLDRLYLFLFSFLSFH